MDRPRQVIATYGIVTATSVPQVVLTLLVAFQSVLKLFFFLIPFEFRFSFRALVDNVDKQSG